MPIDSWGEWCDGCNWNVDRTPPKALKRREERAKRRNEARNRRLFEEMLAEGLGGDRRIGFPRIASYILAVAVLVTAALPFVGAALILVALGVHPGPVVVAVVLVCIGWNVRPKSPKMPQSVVVLSRDDAPSLYGLVDTLADRLGISHISMIGINAGFNASVGRVGVRQRSLMIIGLPLWDLLEPQERIAVLAHELGHALGGDLVHSGIVGRSLDTLRSWYLLWRPTAWEVRRARGAAFSYVPMYVLAYVVRKTAELQMTLIRRSTPRKEYRADEAAARLASTDAACSSLDKMLLVHDIQPILSRALQRRNDEDPWMATRSWIVSIPPREHERRRRLSERNHVSVDATHPPTTMRVDILRRRPPCSATVTTAAATEAAISAEIAPAREKLVEMAVMGLRKQKRWFRRS